MTRGRLHADGWVPTREVRLRMAQGHLLADGQGLSNVVCGWRRGCLTDSRTPLFS